MHVVALVDAPAFTPAHARQLAAALGCSPMDAADRLRVPGRGPAVVKHFAYEPPARQLASVLKRAGFSTIILGPAAPDRPPIAAHAVGIDPQGLHLDAADGRYLIAVDEVAAVVWGVRIVEEGDLNRDVVFRGRQRTERWGFVWIFTAQGEVAQVEESQMHGVREGGFATMAEAIRRACGRAPFDDRLLAVRAQRQILGAQLAPSQHLPLAIRLIARARTSADGITTY